MTGRWPEGVEKGVSSGEAGGRGKEKGRMVGEVEEEFFEMSTLEEEVGYLEKLGGLEKEVAGALNKILKHSDRVGAGRGKEIKTETFKVFQVLEAMKKMAKETEKEIESLQKGFAMQRTSISQLKKDLASAKGDGLLSLKEEVKGMIAGVVEELRDEGGCRKEVAEAGTSFASVAGKGKAVVRTGKKMGKVSGGKKGKTVGEEVLRTDTLRIRSKKEYPELVRKVKEGVPEPEKVGVMVTALKKGEDGALTIKFRGNDSDRRVF